MKRDLLLLLRNSKFTFDELTWTTPSRGFFKLYVDGLKVQMNFRKRTMMGLVSLDIYCSHATFYTSSHQIRQDTANGFGTDGGPTAFKLWVTKKALPYYKEEKKKKEKEKDFNTKAKEICGGDPRIKFIQDWDGSQLITFRVDDVTDGGKMADFYREYLNGTALPTFWYFENGRFFEDRERFAREEKARKSQLEKD